MSFAGYNMKIDNMQKLNGNAQTVIVIKEGICYKRCRHLELPMISTIWLDIGIPGSNKKFLLQAYYRQWNVLGRDNTFSTKTKKQLNIFQ